MRRFVPVAALCLAGSGIGACEITEGWVAMAPLAPSALSVAFRTAQKPSPVSRPFDVEFCLSGADTQTDRLAVDATMPAHQHGMNYKPDVTEEGQGRYRATGMVFHMPGLWRLAVSAYRDGEPTHFETDLTAR